MEYRLRTHARARTRTRTRHMFKGYGDFIGPCGPDRTAPILRYYNEHPSKITIEISNTTAITNSNCRFTTDLADDPASALPYLRHPGLLAIAYRPPGRRTSLPGVRTARGTVTGRSPVDDIHPRPPRHRRTDTDLGQGRQAATAKQLHARGQPGQPGRDQDLGDWFDSLSPATKPLGLLGECAKWLGTTAAIASNASSAFTKKPGAPAIVPWSESQCESCE